VSLDLRKATEDDRQFLITLYGTGRASEMAIWGWSEEQQKQFIAMQYLARRCHYDAVYPERDDSIILAQGLASGVISVARGKTGINLVDIAILPEFQGKGLASTLVQALQQEALENGKSLHLHVVSENSPAVRLYQRLGFACIGDDGVYQHLEWRPAGAENVISSGEIHA
jgi:predicted GNAT family acetyltransferase